MTPQFLSRAKAAPFVLTVISVLVLSSCGGASKTTTTTPTPAASNTVAVTIGFGPNGEAGGYVNGIFTNITVCQHATSNCATIDNVLVDTGSVGLRILPSSLGSVALSPISADGNPLEECIQFGDTSYTWGPMQSADVEIAGETASNMPVQLLGDNTSAVPSKCLSTPVNPGIPNGGDDDSLATLGANGVLGIGDGAWDCGTACTDISIGSTYSGYPYYICPNGTCEEVPAPTGDQATNPIAAFTSSDTNGVMINLQSVGATGAASGSGTMNFGIGTQSDNALGTATLYAMDECGDFPTVTYNGVSYADTYCTNQGGGFGGFLDTGSNALYVSDASTLAPVGIYDCPQNSYGYGFYCVSGGTATLSNIALFTYGNVGSGTISLNIADATTLFTSNNAVFNNLGGDSGTSPATDYFDIGLPFFLGRTVFIGIGGETVPNGVSAPYGFVAF